MKQYIKVIAALLVLLMTVAALVACSKGSSDKDDLVDREKETETEREAETDPQLTQKDIDQLKSDMADSILKALENTQVAETTEAGTQAPVGTNADYADVVEGLLGSLDGLGNGDYNYTKIISDVLDQYIGSDNTSDFIISLIMNWLKNNMESSVPSVPIPEQTTEEVTTERVTIPEETEEEQATQEQQQGSSMEALRDYVAKQSAEAITDAIVERINEDANTTLRDAIYDSVYSVISGNNGFLDGVMGESFPEFDGFWS